MIYFYLSTAVFVGGMFLIYWLHNQYHLDIIVEPAAPPRKAPLISVCIPARNEERNIRRCVEAMLAQDYPNLEVIVLNDRSTDSTPQILRQLSAQNDRLKIINGSDLPEGWAGKPHALYQAAAAARGEWLCFVDADTFVTPQAVSSCYTKALETNADMFTILTFQILGTFWEKVVMPLIMTALSVGFSPRKVNDPNSKDAIANGQFILIRRSVYDAIGGHAHIKDQIVEDKAIAEQVKWNGYRLIVANGYDVARTHMYTSLPEIWEGWIKNIYLGLRGQFSLLILGVLVLLIATLFLPIWAFLGVLWYLRDGGWLAGTVIIEALILWTFLIDRRARAAKAMGISPWYAFTTPLGTGVFAAMMLVSTWKVLSGKGVTWKGRTYAPK
ncbi:MAG TPA: glycosyltransferase [Anaerolineales bacterium]|nr:glycosyltransferase [Anaerolineales bacterium]